MYKQPITHQQHNLTTHNSQLTTHNNTNHNQHKSQLTTHNNKLRFTMDEELTQLLQPQDPNDVLYGYQMESVVGIRYAQGATSLRYGTWLNVARESDNDYDPNAIRVDTQNGLKVGYIRSVYAQKLSMVMDNGVLMNHLKVKCVALDSPDDYDVRTLVVFYGPEQHKTGSTTELLSCLKSGVWFWVNRFFCVYL